MLTELTIENVAVIEKASIFLKDGFTCLTGETGAGKSIIIDSINAIMGDRISKDIVRVGAEKASIVAVFENIDPDIVSKAKEYDIDITDECIVSRQISAQAKSSARINGMPVAVNVIKNIFGDAINIHGQHDSQSLLNPLKHIKILDSFGTDINIEDNYIKLYKQYTALKHQINDIMQSDKSKKEDIELLQFQVQEIINSEISLQEEEDLNEQKILVKNSEKIILSLSASYELLSGNDEITGAVNALQQAALKIQSIEGFSKNIDNLSEKLNDISVLGEDISFEIRNIIDDFDVDINSLEYIEQRLDLYYNLKRKYGNSVQAILDYCDKAQEKLENIQFYDEKLKKLNAEYQQIRKQLETAAEKLTKERIKQFNLLSDEIKNSLEFLNMPDVKLFLQIENKQFAVDGKDLVEFTIVTNKGETPKPLAKIASGGELSRIMLAIKSVLAEKETTQTLIFDEIDSGVSGAAALKIGRLLKSTAKNRQVLCVTHSPQIAAFSDNHLYIQKIAGETNVKTTVKELSKEEKIAEIARIISGENITPAAIENAKEMIESAQNC